MSFLRKLILGLSAGLLLCSVVAVYPRGELLTTSFAYNDDDDDYDDDDYETSVEIVRVDCFDGESINEALEEEDADELIIEIDGICDEDVLVRRDNVTLRGINLDGDGEPEDGIRAVSTDPNAPPNFGVALAIDYAAVVTVENLILTGGARHGLRVSYSGGGPVTFVRVINCRLENNTDRGLALGRATVFFEDTVITGNGTGATTMNNSGFICDNCLIEGGLTGSHSTFRLTDSELDGSLRINNRSFLGLINTDQTANPSFNALNDNSELRIRTGSTIIGPTRFRNFSTGVLLGGTTHTGNLSCGTGSDVVCPGATVTGTSNCSQCLVP